MPTGVLVCGSSGTGKTTIRDKFKKKSYLVFDTDEVDADTQEERSRINFERTHSAINSGKNLLYDGTCRNYAKTIEIVEHMKQKDYKVIIVITYTKLSTALDRISKRERTVPESVVKRIYEEIKRKAERYMDKPDEIYLYNNEESPTLIYSRKNKKIKCILPESEFYFDVSSYCD
jgi:predicted ABC-type ATPase